MLVVYGNILCIEKYHIHKNIQYVSTSYIHAYRQWNYDDELQFKKNDWNITGISPGDMMGNLFWGHLGV